MPYNSAVQHAAHRHILFGPWQSSGKNFSIDLLYLFNFTEGSSHSVSASDQKSHCNIPESNFSLTFYDKTAWTLVSSRCKARLTNLRIWPIALRRWQSCPNARQMTNCATVDQPRRIAAQLAKCAAHLVNCTVDQTRCVIGQLRSWEQLRCWPNARIVRIRPMGNCKFDAGLVVLLQVLLWWQCVEHAMLLSLQAQRLVEHDEVQLHFLCRKTLLQFCSRAASRNDTVTLLFAATAPWYGSRSPARNLLWRTPNSVVIVNICIAEPVTLSTMPKTRLYAESPVVADFSVFMAYNISGKWCAQWNVSETKDPCRQPSYTILVCSPKPAQLAKCAAHLVNCCAVGQLPRG